MLEYELKEVLLKIEGHEVLGQHDMRQEAVLAAVNIASMIGMKTGMRLVSTSGASTKPAWAGDVVAYIELPTGEVSYFLQKDDSAYAGYTRTEKLDRITRFMNDEEQKDGLSESIEKELLQ